MAALDNNSGEHLQETASEDDSTIDRGVPKESDEFPVVLCDSCIESPGLASKFCRTCLVSYCELHLRPHLEKEKFQSHVLVDPRQDVEAQICEHHQLPLQDFCLSDGCCICLDCCGQEHDGHPTASLKEARATMESELEEKHKEICLNVRAAEKATERLHSNSDNVKASAQEVGVTIERLFTKLQTNVDEAKKRVKEVLKEEQTKVLSRAESIEVHLEQKTAQMTKISAQINRLSNTRSDVDFVQDYYKWSKSLPHVYVPSVHVERFEHSKSYVEAVTELTQEICDICSSFMDKLNVKFKRDGRNLAFDPDTIHRFLRLTEDDRKLTNTSPWQHPYPNHPGRFEHWRQAVTSESLYAGKHYMEAELSGDGAHVGVTCKSIDRKGERRESCITGSDRSWCVGRKSRGFSAWHGDIETILPQTDVTKIGLFIDFHLGSVSFYDATSCMKPLHTYKLEFIEPLYVTVWLSKKDNAVRLCTLD